MNFISKFFHEIAHPHCPDCINDTHESMKCESCETLREQLMHVTESNNKLMARLLDKPVVEPVINTNELKPISTNQSIPWRVRQQALETEDRHTAQLLKNKAIELQHPQVDTGKSTIEELENVVGLKEN